MAQAKALSLALFHDSVLDTDAWVRTSKSVFFARSCLIGLLSHHKLPLPHASWVKSSQASWLGTWQDLVVRVEISHAHSRMRTNQSLREIGAGGESEFIQFSCCAPTFCCRSIQEIDEKKHETLCFCVLGLRQYIFQVRVTDAVARLPSHHLLLLLLQFSRRC